eukprot:TRINITY_DN16932_c0_g1_i1.p1 TRINITY_DN16932_c0_g1~~TRINITY_DN16932_c0_g1_i1.p1  ORF type:complete len:291 (-),score=46.80 TRINITY_DN16932_c0_g1_i1:21-833(-)
MTTLVWEDPPCAVSEDGKAVFHRFRETLMTDDEEVTKKEATAVRRDGSAKTTDSGEHAALCHSNGKKGGVSLFVPSSPLSLAWKFAHQQITNGHCFVTCSPVSRSQSATPLELRYTHDIESRNQEVLFARHVLAHAGTTPLPSQHLQAIAMCEGDHWSPCELAAAGEGEEEIDLPEHSDPYVSVAITLLELLIIAKSTPHNLAFLAALYQYSLADGDARGAWKVAEEWPTELRDLLQLGDPDLSAWPWSDREIALDIRQVKSAEVGAVTM